MAKISYLKGLQIALDQTAIEDCKMSNAEIEAAIAFISEQLKGHLPNDERLLLVADRSELRATLKKRAHPSVPAREGEE